MLAPSKPKSMQSNLPAEPPTPLRTIAKMFQNLSIEDDVAALASMNKNDKCPPSPSEAQKNCQKEIIEEAAHELVKTNIGYLIGNNVPLASAPMVHTSAQPIPSLTATSLLSITLKTENEALLLAALKEQDIDIDNL
ncbi:hypothetical protein BDQ17DRAFT_1437590 [Cyathus striatus]|nr:hypothetical protein BDQ17DRAFT_1437590 [Cyathus striatus]